jgi:hypothetical protein
MTRRGGAGKGSVSKGCRGAEHGQACTKYRTGAVALRAALESAVQLGRGDEVNRQAEMASPAKCRDSLQTYACIEKEDLFSEKAKVNAKNCLAGTTRAQIQSEV